MTIPLQSPYLKEREAAQYINMSQSWLKQGRLTGLLDSPPYLKIGRSIRYQIQDLDQWLSSKKRSFNTY